MQRDNVLFFTATFTAVLIFPFVVYFANSTFQAGIYSSIVIITNYYLNVKKKFFLEYEFVRPNNSKKTFALLLLLTVLYLISLIYIMKYISNKNL